MSVNLLRSVSVIAISASLAMPSPILAQSESEAAEGTPAAETCPDGSEPVLQEGSETLVCPSDAPAQEEEAAEPAAAEPAAAAAAGAETPEAVEGGAAGTDAAAAEPEAAPADVAESETAATEEPVQESETATTEVPAADSESTATEEPAAEGETAATEEPAAEGETAATEEPAADTEGETAATEERPAEATGDATETEATAEAEGGPEAEADAPADTATLPATDGATEADGATTEGETAAAPEDTGQTETETATEDTAVSGDAAPSEVTQDDTAQSTAEANAAVETEAAAAAAETATVEPSDADTVETITEETARSSSEEFATTATAPADRDSGLSSFEKFALGALGVAAVATILNKNDKVVVSSDDRLVVQDDSGNYRVLKNDDELLRRPGVQVTTREFSDGSTRTMVTREDGVRVVTIRAPDGQVLKRTRILPDGREIVLFDDTAYVEPVEMSFLEQYRPSERTVDANDPDALRAALMALENPTNRAYSLQQIRQIRSVRELVPEIDLDAINFDTGSAVIRPEEAVDLSEIGKAISAAIDENPSEVFLIEGHTDATGGAAMNLALSDRRAESAALALTEYFGIPPENLVVQGYGESNLKIRTNEAERENRRVAVRRITPLLYAQR